MEAGAESCEHAVNTLEQLHRFGFQIFLFVVMKLVV